MEAIKKMKKVKLMLVGLVAIGAFVFGVGVKEASFNTAYTKPKTDNIFIGFGHGKHID